MTSILWPAVSVLGSVAVLGSVVAWCRAQVVDLRAAGEFMEESYRAAQRLVKSNKTPEPVLDFVEWFMARSGNPQLARRVALSLILQHLRLEPKAAPRPGSIYSEVRKLPPAEAEAFAVMVSAGLLASAAADPVFSRAYIRALHTIFDGNAVMVGKNKAAVAQHPSVDVAADLVSDLCAPRAMAHAA